MGYQEITPEDKPLKELYVKTMLWFVGRAIQASARVDQEVKDEFAQLPPGFTFCMGVMPDGPYMVVGKDPAGQVQYLGADPAGHKIDLHLKVKNLEAAFLLFTFQESTAMASCRNRLILDGELPHACAIVRVLNIVEVYLLPKLVASLAVKRYPLWSPMRKYLGRTRLYLRTLLG